MSFLGLLPSCSFGPPLHAAPLLPTCAFVIKRDLETLCVEIVLVFTLDHISILITRTSCHDLPLLMIFSWIILRILPHTPAIHACCVADTTTGCQYYDASCLVLRRRHVRVADVGRVSI